MQNIVLPPFQKNKEYKFSQSSIFFHTPPPGRRVPLSEDNRIGILITDQSKVPKGVAKPKPETAGFLRLLNTEVFT